MKLVLFVRACVRACVVCVVLLCALSMPHATCRHCWDVLLQVSFRKKPDEGRMKGLAFAYDPDGLCASKPCRLTHTGNTEANKHSHMHSHMHSLALLLVSYLSACLPAWSGYWVEIVKRAESHQQNRFTLGEHHVSCCLINASLLFV